MEKVDTTTESIMKHQQHLSMFHHRTKKKHPSSPSTKLHTINILPLFCAFVLTIFVSTLHVAQNHARSSSNTTLLHHNYHNSPVQKALAESSSRIPGTKKHFPPPQTSTTNETLSLRTNKHVVENLTGTREHFELIYADPEVPLPNPPLSDGNTTFSACLLVMDDNHRLTEWMAYHYHVLPLRTMIVAVDPRSQYAPTRIFNEWRKRGVVITEWSDNDFWISNLRSLSDDESIQTKRDRHRGRQKFFYKQCLIQMKQLNRTWVSLHDSDEFLVYNHPSGETTFQNWQAKHGAKNRNRLKPSRIPPSTADEGAMIQYINQERAAGLNYYQSPCIGIPRLMFGAPQDDNNEEEHARMVETIPNVLHPHVQQLDTLRYRKHAPRNDFHKNALAKVIIDVSRIDDIAKLPRFLSLHRPIKALCPSPWQHDDDVGLRINHYLGSWESYSFREDARRGSERSLEQYLYKATTIGEQTDDIIRPWVSGFVATHGETQAKQILQHAGLPTQYHNTDPQTIERWKLHSDVVQKIFAAAENATDSKLQHFVQWLQSYYNITSSNNNGTSSSNNNTQTTPINTVSVTDDVTSAADNFLQQQQQEDQLPHHITESR